MDLFSKQLQIISCHLAIGSNFGSAWRRSPAPWQQCRPIVRSSQGVMSWNKAEVKYIWMNMARGRYTRFPWHDCQMMHSNFFQFSLQMSQARNLQKCIFSKKSKKSLFCSFHRGKLFNFIHTLFPANLARTWHWKWISSAPVQGFSRELRNLCTKLGGLVGELFSHMLVIWKQTKNNRLVSKYSFPRQKLFAGDYDPA